MTNNTITKVIIALIITLVFSGYYIYTNKDISISPEQAIFMTAEAADSNATVSGVFELKVQAVKEENLGKMSYLNSELDYRDQRNITIDIPLNIRIGLTDKYNDSLENIFMDKKIRVNGVAKRMKVNFYSHGVKTDKYYYQTHVRIYNIDQIEVI